jgi:predicted dienelactone hydrolase
MRKLIRVLVVLVLLACVGGAYFLWRVSPKIPERPFPKPAGPYGVGTREFDWTDSSRGESYTRNPNDKRRILVQAWYPVATGTTGDTARYLRYPDGFSSRLGAFAARKARTNSVVDAPIAPPVDSTGWPVLIYNHGGAWTRWSATFAAEWLASHGYTVFSVEHFGFNQTIKYPDGSRFVADTLSFPKETGDGKKDALASWAYLDDPVFKIWAADARFALDQIERLARESGPFQGRLDLGRIGAYGWSFGGALAIELTAIDPRVIAAVDHDGQLFGQVKEQGTTRPVFQFHHGYDDALDYPEKQRAAVHEMMALTDSWDSTTRARSTGDWYSATIANTTHGDFSDLSLFYPRPKGHIPAERAHDIIDRYTLAFFDRYLKGKESPLLEKPDPEFPEVTFRAWPAAQR